MTATLAPPRPAHAPGTLAPAGPEPRPTGPPLAALALPPHAYAGAGRLLGPRPALVLVEGGEWAPLDADLAAAAAAGFDVLAAETLPAGGLEDRLRDANVGCVAVHGPSAGRVRALARATGGPVLAMPAGGAATDGPVVMAAEDAEAVPRVADVLATRHALLVARHEPVPRGTLVRSSGHPGLFWHLDQLSGVLVEEERMRATVAAERAVALAQEHGLKAHGRLSPDPAAIVRLAAEHGGVAVIKDRGGRRAPGLLRRALREQVPVLLLPAA